MSMSFINYNLILKNKRSKAFFILVTAALGETVGMLIAAPKAVGLQDLDDVLFGGLAGCVLLSALGGVFLTEKPSIRGIIIGAAAGFVLSFILFAPIGLLLRI